MIILHKIEYPTLYIIIMKNAKKQKLDYTLCGQSIHSKE